MMAPALRLCSGAEAVRKLKRAGWTVSRQRGSHVMMVKPGYQFTLSIPQHDELGPGLLRKLIRQANLGIDEFNSL
jgi:predicted RNA binding protein YcfA (HicA-like mRNA interferase family)